MVSKAKVEISFAIDLEKFAEFYGDELGDETERDALMDLETTLRHAFQAKTGNMRAVWYQAVVGRPVPVPGEAALEPIALRVADTR